MRNDKPWRDAARTFEERARLLLAAMTDAEKLGQVNYRNQAIPRLGEVADVINVVDFFVQPASDFITGQVVYLGGVS